MFVIAQLFVLVANGFNCEWVDNFPSHTFYEQRDVMNNYEMGANQILSYGFEESKTCDCEDDINWNFPIICSILGGLLLITMILCISLNFREFCDISLAISDMMSSLNCWGY